MSISFRRSLIPSLLASLVSLITAVSLVLVSVLVAFENSRLVSQLEAQAEATADQLAATLAFPIWNVIGREIDNQLDWVMLDQSVYGVTLITEGLAPPLRARSRDEAWRPTRSAPAVQGELVTVARTVLYDGSSIASLELHYTKRFVAERIAREAIFFAFLVFAEDLSIAFGLALILRATVFRPLQKIERYAAAVSSGSVASIPPLEGARGEIESLHASIGKMVGLLGERYEDIVRKDAEKGILVQELFHRTKNNLQVMAGLVSLRESRLADGRARAELRDLAKRIQAMALAQDQLRKFGDLSYVDLGAYLEELLPLSLQGRETPPRCEVRAEKVVAVIDVAMPLGIAVIELASNSLEHAFPNGRAGTVSAELSLEEDGCIKIALSDDGIGPPPGFDPRRDASLGLELVFILIERQLKGSVAFDFSSGFSATLRFGITCFEHRV